MPIRKRIPDSEEGFDLMLQNMNEKCTSYKAALNISDTQLATLDTNAESYHGWRLLKNQISQTKTSITEFVRIINRGNKNDPMPTTPDLVFEIPPLPAKPGIEQQTEEFILYLEMQDNFTDAMGLDLGFYENVGEGLPSDQKTAEFSVEDLLDYALKITYSRKGLKGFLIKYRIKGTNVWTNVTLSSSPYVLQITPDPDGKAITLEMQGVLIEDNKLVGLPSDVKTVIAHA